MKNLLLRCRRSSFSFPASDEANVLLLLTLAVLCALLGVAVYVAVPSSWIPSAAAALGLIAVTEACRLRLVENRASTMKKKQ
jgi:hypothetical protein